MFTWSSDSYTDTGKIRSLNEDSILDCNSEHLWAVADGMGGHESGDYASQLVVAELAMYRATRFRGLAIARISDTLRRCNDHLISKANTDGVDIIGCTVAVLSIHGQHAVCSWSGDSRIYRIRGTHCRQLTRDHSNESLSEDRDLMINPAPLAGDPQMLTHAIGGDEASYVEHCWFWVATGDRYFICTDGLNKEVSDEEILATAQNQTTDNGFLKSLADLYQERGARDNVGMIHISANPA